MPRPRGRRNADFDTTRETLLARIHARLESADGPGLSLSEMAVAAEVTLPTLRHYFGDRGGVLQAILERMHREGQVYLREVAAAPLPGLRDSVRGYLEFLAAGLRSGILRMYAVGATNGMQEAGVARACLSELLEPIINSLEVRLARHQASGEMRVVNVRHAAMALIAPVMIALQHQEELGGRSYRPLELGAFLDDLTDAFVRAHAVDPAAPVDAPATPPIV